MKDEKLTLKQFSEKVGYSTRQVSRYISQGRLIPRIGLNGRYYFTGTDVVEFNQFFVNKKELNILDLTTSENKSDDEQ